MIRLIRNHAMMDLFRAYKIILNGEEVGSIRNGKFVEIDVPPGTYHLQLKIDWCYSNEIEFDCNDELLEFECGNNYVGKRSFLGVFNVLGAGGDYLWLKQKA